MKSLCFLLLLSVSAGWAQPAPQAPAKPDAVIAIFEDGSKMTEGEYETLLLQLPDDNWRNMAEQKPQDFLHLLGVMRKLKAGFDSQKLGDKYKAGVDFAMMKSMADFFVLESTRALTPTDAEIQKYYDDHLELYKRVHVRGIKIAFGATGEPAPAPSNASRIPKKERTEDEAAAKADKVVADLRAGADFLKVQEAESDDESLKSKGGDLGSYNMTDNLPDLIRSNMLALKQGQYSDPIRQTGAYYIVQADSVKYQPMAEVKDAISALVLQQKGKDWLENFQKSVKVEYAPKEPVPPAAPSEPKK